ncbi:hypothetical protein BaRGS_00019025 [Batillaria attramentaria]|uniref:NuBaID C-terminal domain-containing protein n=1 Tax=Batillaria attramentaria TaxID=370345 RepID=A0ABD0KQS4_9CAEN
MAGNPITPQRVREILSSFLYKSGQTAPQTQQDEESTSQRATEAAGSNKRSSLTSGGTDNMMAKPSPEIASVRRSYSSFLKRVETFSISFADYNKEACSALEGKLVSSHEKFCTLAVNPCPESYLKVCLEEPDELQRNFLLRLNTLKQCTHPLPDLDYTKLEIWGFSEGHAAKFHTEERMSEADVPTQIITLAFTGWTLSEGNKEILLCSMCRRQVGLWNYSPAANRGDDQNGHTVRPDSSGAGDGEPPTKLLKMTPQDKLDPVSCHHLWCPWNALRELSEDALSPALCVESPQSPSSPLSPATPQSPPQTLSPGGTGASPGDGGDIGARRVPAWVLVAQIVAPGLLSQSRRLVQQVKQSSMTDGLRCIRRMLNTWSSPEKGTPTTPSH